MIPKPQIATSRLKRWTLPRDYMGARWDDWYVFLGQHRDSDSVTRSNFTCGLRDLGGESETVVVIRESHWAVGWVEWIGIHCGDAAATAKAEAMLAQIDEYTLLDEMHHSELEWNEAADYWARMRVCERLEICQRFGLSIFAARHDYMPSDDDGSLFDYLRC